MRLSDTRGYARSRRISLGQKNSGGTDAEPAWAGPLLGVVVRSRILLSRRLLQGVRAHSHRSDDHSGGEHECRRGLGNGRCALGDDPTFGIAELAAVMESLGQIEIAFHQESNRNDLIIRCHDLRIENHAGKTCRGSIGITILLARVENGWVDQSSDRPKGRPVQKSHAGHSVNLEVNVGQIRVAGRQRIGIIETRGIDRPRHDLVPADHGDAQFADGAMQAISGNRQRAGTGVHQPEEQSGRDDR